jgi:hypothetical protein
MHWNRGTRKPVSPSLPVARLASWLVCATVAIGLAPAGRANTVEFATGSQTLGGWVMENASAGFDINGNSITAQLLDLSVNQFNVATGILSPTMGANPATDTKLGIDGNGITVQSLDLSVNQFNVNQAICFPCFSFNGATGILNPTIEPSDTYAAADATLTTNTSAQWIIGSGVTYIVGNGFPTFDTSPVNSGTTTDPPNVVIPNVIFGFGEGANFGTELAPLDAPEPGSVILFGTGLGLLAIAAGARRLRRR